MPFTSMTSVLFCEDVAVFCTLLGLVVAVTLAFVLRFHILFQALRTLILKMLGVS